MKVRNSAGDVRRKYLHFAMASVGIAALIAPATAWAQDVPAEEASEDDSGYIIVTARRSDERLQDVPANIQAVTGEALQKLNITTVDDLAKIVPGLTLVNNNASTQVTLRGVSWRPGSGTPATPIYFNEVPFDPPDHRFNVRYWTGRSAARSARNHARRAFDFGCGDPRHQEARPD